MLFQLLPMPRLQHILRTLGANLPSTSASSECNTSPSSARGGGRCWSLSPHSWSLTGDRGGLEAEDRLKAEQDWQQDRCWRRWHRCPGPRERAGACPCHRPLVKVTLSVAASVSPEICFGGSVVNQRAGPEANTLPQGLSSHWIPCGPWRQGRAVEVSRNRRLRGGEASPSGLE